MRIILALAALLVLSGCGTLDHTSVSVSSGYSNYYPASHISYTLGFYSGGHYNGYRVHGSYGQRYYYAPRHYANHHYYSAPVIVHQTIRPRHYTPPRHTPQVRNYRHESRDDRRHRNKNRH